jgi:hypothetical protein
VLLDKAIYWIAVTSMDGSALWLGNTATGDVSIRKNGHSQSVNNLELLGEVGQTLPIMEGQPQGNLSLQFDGILQPVEGLETDATASFSSLPETIQLLSGEKGSIVLYPPEIEYS